MNKTTLTLIIYSVILSIGGIIGFIIAGSIPSLVMSSIFSLLILLSLLVQQQFPQAGYRMTYALLTLLEVFFIFRGFYTEKFMPSGILAIITLLVIALMYYFENRAIKNNDT